MKTPRMRQIKGSSLVELMLVMCIGAIIPMMVIMSFDRSQKDHFLPTIVVSSTPLSSIEACQEVNFETDSNELSKYSLFDNGCYHIWTEAAELISITKTENVAMVGVTVIKGKRIERYLPILETNEGHLIYPGGAQALLEPNEHNQNDFEKINMSIGKKL